MLPRLKFFNNLQVWVLLLEDRQKFLYKRPVGTFDLFSYFRLDISMEWCQPGILPDQIHDIISAAKLPLTLPP